MSIEKEKYGLGPYKVTELSHYTITLSDNINLSCRIWIPDSRHPTSSSFSSQFLCFNTNNTDVEIINEGEEVEQEEKFPVILEYLPYYKDILTATRDYNRHPWFTSHGFVVMRVEMRGTGGSDGYYYGEYLSQEFQDCSEVLKFISDQSWSNGKVGMYGKSWGGFNGLQMAFLEPENSPLKTAISLYSTDNRYTDDIHYEGGCPIGSGLLSWSSWMFAMNALPPPPRIFKTKKEWFQVWLNRLEKTSKSYMSSWTNQQLPGPYWQHGSIDEDYDKVTIPILAIGGLEDGYTTAAERMARKLNSSSKVIIGPWVHNWPDVSVTGPRIEYLELCLNWFSYHLKGVHVVEDNKCTSWPRLQLFVRNSFKPDEILCSENGDIGDVGRFVAFPDWEESGKRVEESCRLLSEDSSHGDESDEELVNVLYLSRSSDNINMITKEAPEEGTVCTEPVQLLNRPLQGANSGHWLRIDWGFSGDQTPSISNSVSFCSEQFENPLVMIGVSNFIVKLSASSWRRVYLSVKISDIHPDGFAGLVTRCQYDLNYLEPLKSDSESRTYSLPLRFVSHCFLPGHKICISISPNNFPLMWPSLVPCDLYLHPNSCRLIYQTESFDYLTKNTVTFPSPRPLLSLPYRTTTPNSNSYLVTHIGDRVKFVFQEDSGLEHLPHTMNLKHYELSHESYECDSDVTTALAKIHLEHCVVFDKLEFSDTCEKEVGVRIRTHQVWKGDADSYSLEEKLVVCWSECGEEVFSRSWKDVIPRQDHRSWS